MPQIPYIRPDGTIIGYAVCIKLPDPPHDPRISQAGWPDPAGKWIYQAVQPND
jgi:hypothetical protein